MAKKMASSVIGQLLEQKYVLDLAASPQLDQEKIALLIETNNETYSMILSIEYTLGRQRELGTITDDQEMLAEKIRALKEAFSTIYIQTNNEQKTLWELGPIANAYNDSLNSENFKVISVEMMKLCARACNDFCSSFPDLVPFSEVGNPPPIPLAATVKSFLSNTTFGTIDQLRVELETTYQGVQITLQGHDKKNIDCMWIPGNVDDDSKIGYEEQYLPTMVY